MQAHTRPHHTGRKAKQVVDTEKKKKLVKLF